MTAIHPTWVEGFMMFTGVMVAFVLVPCLAAYAIHLAALPRKRKD